MSTAAGIITGIAIFIYIELAIGFGYYMFLLSSEKTKEPDKLQKKQIKMYSIIAGIAFPVTFAVMMANKMAERR